ncbi:hypothetical protein BKA63DRAFT_405812 [Paraphoma chrysanthemicola]|nr:hypothetical protein BKA63DRAFT_405812 [Paraphoma chrysanthemicola]
MPASNLLNLPRELRDLIYPYVLPDRLRLVPKSCDQSISFHKTNGILLTTQQLRSEAIEALYRLFPSTTIVASCDVFHSILSSPYQSRMRQKIVNLVLKRTYRKRNLPYSVFSLASNDIDDPSLIRASLATMPSLQLVVCELAWAPNHAPALLLPRTRECIIEECRRVTVGSRDLAGWRIDCMVKDKARWRNEWSGIVILTRT